MPDSTSNTTPDLPILQSEHRTCCDWIRSPRLTVALAAVAVIACMAAAYFAGQAHSAKASAGIRFPAIDASAAVSSDDFSMATGVVADSGEGLFVLDHNSGLLQCSILYPRAPIGKNMLGLYTARVSNDLPAGGKGGKYIMVTGQSDFVSNNAAPAAPVVVYVMDTSSGNWVCYGLPFHGQSMNANRPQQGYLIKLGQGTANPIVDRDGR